MIWDLQQEYFGLNSDRDEMSFDRSQDLKKLDLDFSKD
jgi:hypothetical protein